MLNFIVYCIPSCFELQDPHDPQPNCCRAGATYVSPISHVSQDIWSGDTPIIEVLPGSDPAPWPASDMARVALEPTKSVAPVPNAFIHVASRDPLPS